MTKTAMTARAGAVHAHPGRRHRFQQSIWGGDGTVDFIRQQHLGEQGARLKTEVRLTLIEEVEAIEVCGSRSLVKPTR